MGLKIEEEGVVQKFLDVERYLTARDGTIVRKKQLHREIEPEIVIRMSIEIEGDRKDS